MNKIKPNNEEQVAISRRRIRGESPIVVNEIAHKSLYSGFFGTLDSSRIKYTTDRILMLADEGDYDHLIVDLKNIDIIDSSIAGHLVRLTHTLRMVGIRVIFCGIRPVVAQSMVTAGIDNIQGLTFSKNLRTALSQVYERVGYRLVRVKEETI